MSKRLVCFCHLVGIFFLLESATHTCLGKPSAEMMALIEQTTGISREDACIFGDRLYTDIALGTRNGAASVLVLTGEGTLEEVAATPDEDKPTFVFPSLDEVDRLMFGE